MSARMTNQFRVPVLIDRDVYEACKSHAHAKGVSVAQVIREALSGQVVSETQGSGTDTHLEA